MRPAVLARKAVIFVHRWLGLAFCLLFLLWFLSGMVMMYSAYPAVAAGERLAKAESLHPEAIKLSPAEAYLMLNSEQPPNQVSLAMLSGRPVYRFGRGRSVSLVHADDGEVLRWIPQWDAEAIAGKWIAKQRGTGKFQGALLEADQWTLGGQFAASGPLLKFRWPDGQEVYVSAVTGEVAQHTSRDSRILAYLGAIPHWLYFAPLRRNGPLWDKVVVWASGIGTFASLLGLIAGIWMYLPSKRYRYHGAPSSIPYRGQKRLHLILGLVFGFVTCAWVFSGLLSMEPFDWLFDDGNTPSQVARALHGGPIRLIGFRDRSPADALGKLGRGVAVKEMELGTLGGEPYYSARGTPSISRIIPVNGTVFEQFDEAWILRQISQALKPAMIAEARILSQYDAYYLDRHQQHPLPALPVRVNDSADSTLYIDLKTARLVEAYGRRARINRWLYHGLHSWDLPWLYRYRPAWDIFVLLLLVGGTCLCITSVILGFELLQRTLRFSRSNS
jgi:hypothetical protein